MPDGGFKVLSEKLGSDESKVRSFAERMTTAVDAARAVTMDDSAYGVICRPFATMLDPFECCMPVELSSGKVYCMPRPRIVSSATSRCHPNDVAGPGT
ncbi:hypothetical protein [Amycolatopsis sp. cmx-8-4]|uniref:hypothetical protein n=1 Tax=Amycolatopsis sp. cmx-8-4 TaxID=2790947 RepID=UPI00397BE47A